MNWYLQSIESSIEALETRAETGLSQQEAAARLRQYGHNELIEKGGHTPLKVFWKQVTDTMALLLIAAAAVAGLSCDLKNMIAISAIVTVHATLGFTREYHARQAIAALKKLSVPNVKVLRASRLIELPSSVLVPGDIIQVETGNLIPADVRLLEAVNLRIQESALTGRSDPVEKQTAKLSGDDSSAGSGQSLPLGDRRNMGYMGTIVTQGRGLALVVATGMQTELGKIADLIQEGDGDETPFRKKLRTLGKNLTVIGLAIAAVIAILGYLRGDELRHILRTAVSMVVAVVPEGLPIVVAITFALGARHMLAKNALIRKLPAVETLGSVTVICSDKTGTLTENRMDVVALDIANHELDLAEEMDRSGSFTATRQLGAPAQSALSLAAIGGALCNDARLVDEGDDRFHTVGDPTEGALVTAAARMGYWKSSLDASFPRVAELPFDPERKRMTTVHHLGQYDPEVLAGLHVSGHRYIAFTKGGVDGLLDIASHVWVNGEAEVMDDSYKVRVEAANQALAKKGMRVLGVAFRLLNQIPEIIQTDLEQNVTFVGLFGMIEPPREEVRDAVTWTRSAGIRAVMITGDHPLTATEIARQLGIIESDNVKVLTGAELEHLSLAELKNTVDDVQVFARVSSEHKLKIVQALQERGHVVSMTGDGVSDAPALRRADLGVAMGVTSTEVSKEAADMVLLDDNFATIVAAVKEGRTVRDNIREFVRFSVAGNIGRALVMLLAPALGAIPLLPLQLLWLNVLTDGLLGLGIGAEKAAADGMTRPPYSPNEGLFSKGAGIQAIWAGILIGALASGLGAWYYFSGREEWQTMVFTFLAFAQVFQAWASRASNESVFNIGFLGSRFLAGMSLLVAILQLLVLYVSPLREFFSVTSLREGDLLIAFGMAGLVFLSMELGKRWREGRTGKQNVRSMVP